MLPRLVGNSGPIKDSRANHNRWYDPAVGRWLSQDPIGFAGGDENLYRYAADSPLEAVDPSGDMVQLPILDSLLTHRFQKFNATLVDSTGKTQTLLTPSDLYDGVVAIDKAGNKVTSLTIRGHMNGEMVENDTGAGPKKALYFDFRKTIGHMMLNGNDIMVMMWRITDANTRIDFRGCSSLRLAEMTARQLGNGAKVTGTAGRSIHLPLWLGGGAGRFFWWSYSFPPGSQLGGK